MPQHGTGNGSGAPCVRSENAGHGDPQPRFPPSVTNASIAHHLGELHAKVDEVAERAGVSALDRLDLKSALAALPWRDRRHLGLVLQSVRAHAASPALQTAIDVMLGIAGEVWAQSPPPAAEGEAH